MEFFDISLFPLLRETNIRKQSNPRPRCRERLIPLQEGDRNLDFYETVEKRRSVREFQSMHVEEDKLMRILDAGLKAPTHDHLREWEFILVKDPEQRRRIAETEGTTRAITDAKELGTVTRNMTDKMQREMYLKAIPVQKRMLTSSPELLVVCFRMKKPLKESETLFDLNCLASVWACIENILLAMAAEGLYGVTCVPHETTRLKQELRLPEDYEIAAMIPIGYPSKYFVRQKRISLRERMHVDRW